MAFLVAVVTESTLAYVNNLVNIPEESKSQILRDIEEKFSIYHYTTEKEYEIHSLEVVEVKEELGFTTTRLQSKYLHRGGSKAGNTEIRIAGAILNMVKAMLLRVPKGNLECRIKFTKADIARQLINEHGIAVSEKTIQRYLNNTVLPKLQEVYGLNYEQVNGRGGGFLVWTQDLQIIEETNMRLFDDSLAEKSRRKSDFQKYTAIAKKRGTKRSAFNYLMAKGETFNNDRSPDQMISLAAKIYKQAEMGLHSGLTIPHSGRLRIDSKGIIALLARRLTNGAFIRDALFEVFKDIEDTDRMMADVRLENPMGYLTAKVKKRRKKNPDRAETLRKSRQYQKAFHTNSIALYQSELAKESSEIGRAVIAGLIADHEEKIAASAA